MRHYLQLAAITLLTATTAHAQIHMPQLSHKEKDNREDVSWLAPFANPAPEGRGQALVHEPRLRPFLQDHFTAPQSFWNDNESLYETILEFLAVPNQVVLDDNRYLAADGCVVAFCPARGLLFIDLGNAHPLTVFAAVDWVKENKSVEQSGAEYTLWVFSNRPLTTDIEAAAGAEADPKGPIHIPAALTAAISRWAAAPIPGTNTHQNITHAILVDPNGTPHAVPPATIGVNAAQSSQPPTQKSTQSPPPTQPASNETNK
jgi:hypothetical protein